MRNKGGATRTPRSIGRSDIDRQDFVDNVIYDTACKLAGVEPHKDKRLQWDMFWMTPIREAFQKAIIEHGIMTETEFYW
jgi:hypothetical protein